MIDDKVPPRWKRTALWCSSPAWSCPTGTRSASRPRNSPSIGSWERRARWTIRYEENVDAVKIAIKVATDLQRINADIVRVVIAGNSLNETTRDKEATAKAKYLTKVGVMFFEKLAGGDENGWLTFYRTRGPRQSRPCTFSTNFCCSWPRASTPTLCPGSSTPPTRFYHSSRYILVFSPVSLGIEWNRLWIWQTLFVRIN